MNPFLLGLYIVLGILGMIRIILGIITVKIAQEYNRYIIVWVSIVVLLGVWGFAIFFLFLGFSPPLKAAKDTHTKKESK